VKPHIREPRFFQQALEAAFRQVVRNHQATHPIGKDQITLLPVRTQAQARTGLALAMRPHSGLQ
jgi:hypothetical protein